MKRGTMNQIALAAAIVTVTAAAMTPFVLAADQRETSIEEHMVSDTDAVLTIMRTWHNQISQDQSVIKILTKQVSAIGAVRPDGDHDQVLQWNGDKWEWKTPEK